MRYLGYESQTLFNQIIKSVGTPEQLIALVEQSDDLAEVVVSSPFRTTRETPLSTQTFSAVEIETYPGGNNDITKVVQSMPGISPSIGGFRNDIIIRGGAPNETVYYLDGIEIPNINHFSTQGSAGGPVGMINVSFVRDVTLSSSAFGAEFDNPLSGYYLFSSVRAMPTPLAPILDWVRVKRHLLLKDHYFEKIKLSLLQLPFYFRLDVAIYSFFLSLSGCPYDLIIGIISGK